MSPHRLPAGSTRIVRILAVTSSPVRAVAARDRRAPVVPSRTAARCSVRRICARRCIRRSRRPASFAHAPVEIVQFLVRKGVVQAAHRRMMLARLEPFARRAPHPLRGRIGRDQFRVRRLELLQLIHQRVEFGIRNRGIVEHVIAVLVPANLLAQPRDLRSSLCRRRSVAPFPWICYATRLRSIAPDFLERTAPRAV